jgi:hypothetical protein
MGCQLALYPAMDEAALTRRSEHKQELAWQPKVLITNQQLPYTWQLSGRKIFGNFFVSISNFDRYSSIMQIDLEGIAAGQSDQKLASSCSGRSGSAYRSTYREANSKSD